MCISYSSVRTSHALHPQFSCPNRLCKENKLDGSSCNSCHTPITVSFLDSLSSPQSFLRRKPVISSWTYCVRAKKINVYTGWSVVHLRNCRLFFVVSRQSSKQLGSQASLPCRAVMKQGTCSGIQCYKVWWHYSCDSELQGQWIMM